MPASQSSLVSPISQTPTPTAERKQFLWQRPKLIRNAYSSSTGVGHRVTFSGSSKGSGKGSVNGHERENGYSSASQSGSSRPPSPGTNTPNVELQPQDGDNKSRAWQKVNRQTDTSWEPPGLAPASPPVAAVPDTNKPFLVYSNSFLSLLGPSPSLRTLIEDSRVPYFHNSGIFLSRTSTLFFTSAAHPDPSPSAAPSRHLATTMTKVDLYTQGEFSRDKVRTPERTYMPVTGCAWRKGIVLCAQGTLAEPACLIYMEAKRPHKTTPILTNFAGERLNSPHSCVTHADGSLWFTDPHLGYLGHGGGGVGGGGGGGAAGAAAGWTGQATPGFRPRPKLPALLYRFDVEAADLRPMASDLACPTALAFGPDCKTLYVLDLPLPVPRGETNGSNGSGNTNSSSAAASYLPPPPAQIFAYTVLPVGPTAAPFLASKRLFAIPVAHPTSLVTDLFGNVYVGCANGVQVYNVGGSCIGRVVTEGPVSGLCFGRGGELWVSCGNRLVGVRFGKDIRAGAVNS